jgi:dimethylamine/trimethylamine dehydrogenase
VREARVAQLNKLANVEIFYESELSRDDIREFDADCVVLATGARWRKDGVGRWHEEPISGWERATVFTPDDVMSGEKISGSVVVFDDDHYYMGGVIAEKLCQEGHAVTLVTPLGEVSSWAHKTNEQERIQAQLLELGVRVETGTALESIFDGGVELSCAYTEEERELEADSVVLVTSRRPEDRLYRELAGHAELARIGDCHTPGTIATAVYAGHRYARELDAGPIADVPFRREHAKVS